jgi:hypothetical protein
MPKASCTSSKNKRHEIRSFEFGKTLGGHYFTSRVNDWRKDSIGLVERQDSWKSVGNRSNASSLDNFVLGLRWWGLVQ